MESIIYHYCSVEAFRAIIQNKVLWLSSVYNLNDYKEIHWIQDKVRDKIKNSQTKDSFLKYKAFEEIYNNELPNVFIASFSQGDDLLSQWRAYANDGFGVAIGFNLEYFKNNNLILATQVLYDEKKQEDLITEAFFTLDELSNDIDFTSTNFKNICKNIIQNINHLSSCSKNQLFKEEQEVRLIHSPLIINDKNKQKFIFKDNMSEMKFRAVKGNLIPYFELDFSKNDGVPAIIEIVKGPKNKFIDKEVKIFLSNNNLYNVKIRSSKSSYR